MKLFDYSPSMELMIYEQRDDKDIKKIEELFEDLIHIARKKNIQRSELFFKNSTTKSIITDIDTIISNRFGLNIKHINASGIGYASLVTPPSSDNAINAYASEISDMWEDALGECKSDKCDDQYKKPNQIIDIDRDQSSVAYKTIKNIKEVNDKISTGGITFDLKKAKISGLSKNYNTFLLVDFVEMIHYHGNNAKELTAILLHEIGHIFTHIEYSYRTTKTTTVLLESIRSEIESGNSGIDLVKIVSEKTFGKEIKSKNEVTATVELFSSYIDSNVSLSTNNMRSSRDSEQLADQFSSRFGYGLHLSSALNNFGDQDMALFKILAMSQLQSAFFLFLFTINLSISPLVFISTYVLIPILLLYISIIWTGTIFDLILGEEDSHKGTYDNMRRRLERIRLDNIRVLRNSDLPKDVLKERVESIENMSVQINKVIDRTKPLAVMGNFMPWNYKDYTYSQMDYMIEKMMENNLHLMKAKLSTLKG